MTKLKSLLQNHWANFNQTWKLKWAFLIWWCPSLCKMFTFSSPSPEPFGRFQPNRQKASFGEGNSSLFKWRAIPFSKGRQFKNGENLLRTFRNLLKKKIVNFNQNGTKHSLVKVVGIQVYSNEGRPLFQGEIIPKKWKYIDKIFKFFFSISTRQISTTLGTKHLWVVGVQVWSNEGPDLLPRGDNFEIAKIQQ